MSIQLSITTDSLKKILDEQPEVQLKLQSMAIEKIAEELKRKAQNMSIAQFESQIQSTISKAIMEFNKDITSKYRFPGEAKAVIEQIARDYVNRINEAERVKLYGLVDTYFAGKQAEYDKHIEAKVLELIEKQRPALRIQARQEFVDVLQQVQGVKA